MRNAVIRREPAAGLCPNSETRDTAMHMRAASDSARLEAGSVSRQSSRWTVAGENAGRQTAMYSPPPAAGLLYRTHSPAEATTACPAATSRWPPSCSKHHGDLLELRPLSRLLPPLGRDHPGHAHAVMSRVHAAGVLLDLLRFRPHRLDDGRTRNQGWHHKSRYSAIGRGGRRRHVSSRPSRSRSRATRRPPRQWRPLRPSARAA